MEGFKLLASWSTAIQSHAQVDIPIYITMISSIRWTLTKFSWYSEQEKTTKYTNSRNNSHFGIEGFQLQGCLGAKFGMELFCNAIHNPCLDWAFWARFVITNSFRSHSFQTNPLFHRFHVSQSYFHSALDSSCIPTLPWLPIILITFQSPKSSY